MERVSRQTWLSLLVGFLIYAVQSEAASVGKDLEGIRKKIQRERQGLSEVKKKEGSVQQTLDKIERDLGKKVNDLNAANSKLAALLSEMRHQETEVSIVKSSLDQRRNLRMTRVVALYRWHRSGSPLVFIKDPVSFGALQQRKHYLAATVLFDQELVQKLSDETAYQEKLKRELEHKKEELDNQRRLLAQIRDSVHKDAENKKQLLASLRQEQEGRNRALRELEQAALRLQTMMDEMSRRAARKPSERSSGTGLEPMKGKLEWPVRGKVTGGFGKTSHPQFSAEVFRKGIDIEAPIGEVIKAVEKGRVVFADRFAGYGKMLVIDHGERYFSIYAHLSEILKKSGDMVRREDALGLVGDSDSLVGARLYFEMRKDGRSIDPVPWFRQQ